MILENNLGGTAMKKRILAILLILCLLVTPASALTVEQARDLLENYYIDEIPEEILELPTIEEILDALGDPYTTYYSAEEYASFMDTMEDTELVGIGVGIRCMEAGVLITQVAADSPAADAGLQVGDYIIAVDGNNSRGVDSDTVTGWIKGEAGTSVTLTILRGTETFTVTAVRRVVVFPTVTLDKIEDGVGWITCTAFGSATYPHFYEIITTYDDQVDEWVVDLRSNSGGELYAALLAAGCFAGVEAAAYLRDGKGIYSVYQYSVRLISSLGYQGVNQSRFLANGALTSDPVYVLTSESTASAAEIFCAMLRDADYCTSLIIGSRTYGKGVAQSMYEQEDGSAMKITGWRAYSVGGSTNDKVGILPDLLVDAELADEAAALLASPVSYEEDCLYLPSLNVVMSMERLAAPENAALVSAILSALPDSAEVCLYTGGELLPSTREEAAGLCGVTVSKTTFSDIADSPYADAIDTLSVYSIAGGMGDNLFQPEGELTRAQLCALIVKALRFPTSKEGNVFEDVAEDSWYAPYINALYSMGFVTGSDGLFRPDDTVTHQEFLAVLGRVAQWLDMDYYELMREDGLYGDRVPSAEELAKMYGGYSEWARELVWLCDDSLSWASLSEVDATAATSRGEAFQSIYNLLHDSGLMPG